MGLGGLAMYVLSPHLGSHDGTANVSENWRRHPQRQIELSEHPLGSEVIKGTLPCHVYLPVQNQQIAPTSRIATVARCAVEPWFESPDDPLTVYGVYLFLFSVSAAGGFPASGQVTFQATAGALRHGELPAQSNRNLSSATWLGAQSHVLYLYKSDNRFFVNERFLTNYLLWCTNGLNSFLLWICFPSCN